MPDEDRETAVPLLNSLQVCLAKSMKHVSPDRTECAALDAALRSFQPVQEQHDQLADFTCFIRKTIRCFVVGRALAVEVNAAHCVTPECFPPPTMFQSATHLCNGKRGTLR